MTWTLYNKFKTKDNFIRYYSDFNRSINYLAELGEVKCDHNTINVKIEFVSDMLDIMTLDIIVEIDSKNYNTIRLYELILKDNNNIISKISKNGDYNELKIEFDKIFKEYDIMIEPNTNVIFRDYDASPSIVEKSVYEFILINILENKKCYRSVQSEYLHTLLYTDRDNLVIYFELYECSFYSELFRSSQYYKIKSSFDSGGNIIFTIINERSYGEINSSILDNFISDIKNGVEGYK